MALRIRDSFLVESIFIGRRKKQAREFTNPFWSYHCCLFNARKERRIVWGLNMSKATVSVVSEWGVIEMDESCESKEIQAAAEALKGARWLL